jgi:hypothetical protein
MTSFALFCDHEGVWNCGCQFLQRQREESDDVVYLSVSDDAMPHQPWTRDFRVTFRPVSMELGFGYVFFAHHEDGDFD